MKAVKKILMTPQGIFLLKNNSLEPIHVFESNEDAAKILASVRLKKKEDFPFNKILPILKDDNVITHHPGLASILKEEGINIKEDHEDEELAEAIRKKRELIISSGLVKENEYYQDVHSKIIELTSHLLQSASEGRDKLVVQAILFLDDLDKMTNLAVVRIKEWYGLHFPELERKVENPATYCRIVAYVGPRPFFSFEKFKKLNLPENKINQLLSLAKQSMGGELREEDWYPLRDLSVETLNLMEQRKKVEDWIDKVMGEIAPNLKTVAGSLVGARLISMAGSLEELAKKPASKIQVLGAEKALYRSLRTGTAPPKHGVIFQMPIIGKSPWWIRGKLARFVAAKIAIAARLDAYGGEFYGETLVEQINERLDELKKQYPNAPAGKTPIRVISKASFKKSISSSKKKGGKSGKGGKYKGKSKKSKKKGKGGFKK